MIYTKALGFRGAVSSFSIGPFFCDFVLQTCSLFPKKGDRMTGKKKILCAFLLRRLKQSSEHFGIFAELIRNMEEGWSRTTAI